MIEIDIFGGGGQTRLLNFDKQLKLMLNRVFKRTMKELLKTTLDEVNANANALVTGDGYLNQEFNQAVSGNQSKIEELTKDTFKGIIFNLEEDSAYAEFGTGLVGLDSPHPFSNESGWGYAINPERDYTLGWSWNPSWNYPPRTGWTMGLPPSQYMYLAGTTVQKNFGIIYNRILEEELGKLVV